MFIFVFEWVMIFSLKINVIKYYGEGQPQIENIILIKVVLRSTMNECFPIHHFKSINLVFKVSELLNVLIL